MVTEQVNIQSGEVKKDLDAFECILVFYRKEKVKSKFVNLWDITMGHFYKKVFSASYSERRVQMTRADKSNRWNQ